MNFLGIDESNQQMFEGQMYGGRILWPPAFICPATLIRSRNDLESVPGYVNLCQTKLLFREDSFDAATRIRRGRLYSGGGNQPQEWHLMAGTEGASVLGSRKLVTFQTIPWSSVTRSERPINAQLALGTKGAVGLWDVVLVERSAAGYDLLTLRARSSFVPMPEATELKIDPARTDIVQGTINAAVDAAQRLAPTSTADACRNAAVAAITAWLSPQTGGDILKTDLGKLATKLRNAPVGAPAIVVGTAEAINCLHNRGKTNVQAQYPTRPNEEADGDAALAMLGLLLRELRRPAPALKNN